MTSFLAPDEVAVARGLSNDRGDDVWCPPFNNGPPPPPLGRGVFPVSGEATLVGKETVPRGLAPISVPRGSKPGIDEE